MKLNKETVTKITKGVGIAAIGACLGLIGGCNMDNGDNNQITYQSCPNNLNLKVVDLADCPKEITAKGESIKVFGDATILFPLLVAKTFVD